MKIITEKVEVTGSARLSQEQDRRTPIVLIAGLHGDRTDAVGRVSAALGTSAGTVVVRHDLGDADPDEIRRVLHWALVDDELRLVERAPERVALWNDPFKKWHADPCEADEPHPSTTAEGCGGDPGERTR